MRPYLLLAVIGMAGCAVGQNSKPAKLEADHAQCPKGYTADWNYNREICSGNVPCSSILMCYLDKPAPKKPPIHAKPVIKKCSGLTGECAVEGTGTSKWAVLQSPQFIPDTPIDVPAIQEITKERPNCSMSYVSPSPKDGWLHDWTTDTGMVCRAKRPLIWTCADPSRFLLTSVDGKKRICHREQL